MKRIVYAKDNQYIITHQSVSTKDHSVSTKDHSVSTKDESIIKQSQVVAKQSQVVTKQSSYNILRYNNIRDLLLYLDKEPTILIMVNEFTALKKLNANYIKRSIQPIYILFNEQLKKIKHLYFLKSIVEFPNIIPIDIFMLHYTYSNRTLLINNVKDLITEAKPLIEYYLWLSNQVEIDDLYFLNPIKWMGVFLGDIKDINYVEPTIQHSIYQNPGYYQNVYIIDFIKFYPSLLLQETKHYKLQSLIKILLAQDNEISKFMLNNLWGNLRSDYTSYAIKNFCQRVMNLGYQKLIHLKDYYKDFRLIGQTIDSIFIQSNQKIKLEILTSISQRFEDQLNIRITHFEEMVIFKTNQYIGWNYFRSKVITPKSKVITPKSKVVTPKSKVVTPSSFVIKGLMYMNILIFNIEMKDIHKLNSINQLVQIQSFILPSLDTIFCLVKKTDPRLKSLNSRLSKT